MHAVAVVLREELDPEHGLIEAAGLFDIVRHQRALMTRGTSAVGH